MIIRRVCRVWEFFLFGVAQAGVGRAEILKIFEIVVQMGKNLLDLKPNFGLNSVRKRA